MVKIIADSTCDLSAELLAKYDIDILPLHVLMGEKECRDGIDTTPEELFKWSEDNSTTPRTSAPSLTDAIDILKPYVDNGREVVCFSISASMSTSGNVMRLAVEELRASKWVKVVDSANLSTGIGLLVIEAAIMAQNGSSAKDIVSRMEVLKPKVRASFVVDTLTYLARGGRCSSVSALIGSVLKIHPLIAVENGAMGAGKKYRGKMAKVILDYARELEEAMKHSDHKRVFITHTQMDPAIVESVRAYLESLHIFDEILITTAGSVISSHCGPGTLGVLFISE